MERSRQSDARVRKAVDNHACSTGKDITIVFDKDPGELPEMFHIEVVIARRRGPNAADYEIARLVADEESTKPPRVVTTDRRLIAKVREAGAKVVSSGKFRRELDR